MARTRHRTKSKKSKKARQATAVCDVQKKSKFFQELPPELRNMIYSYLFASTTLSYNVTSYRPKISFKKVEPPRNDFAILQTCRRAKGEIGDSWIGQVLFSFKDPQIMLDTLRAIPRQLISKICHLRVFGDSIVVEKGAFGSHRIFYLYSMLQLLPGLRLDVLTVLDTGYLSSESQHALNGLLESQGWKELHYICYHSTISKFETYKKLDGYGVETYGYRRKAHPAHWQRVLEKRDSVDSNPTVMIYCTTVPRCRGSVMNPNTRVRFECPGTEQEIDESDETTLMSCKENSKEVMMVAKRGSGCDYEMPSDSALLPIDMRREFPKNLWESIRTLYPITTLIGHYGDWPVGHDGDCDCAENNWTEETEETQWWDPSEIVGTQDDAQSYTPIELAIMWGEIPAGTDHVESEQKLK